MAYAIEQPRRYSNTSGLAGPVYQSMIGAANGRNGSMIDDVNILRAEASAQGVNHIGDTMRQAADEIEKLRCQWAGMKSEVQVCHQKIECQRGILQDFLDCEVITGRSRSIALGQWHQAMERAKSALEETPDKESE